MAWLERGGEALVGLWLVVLLFRSLITVTLLERHRSDPVADVVARTTWRLLRRTVGRGTDPVRTERRLLWVWPVSLFVLMGAWYVHGIVAFAFLYLATGSAASLSAALLASGSALSTLGYVTPPDVPGQVISIAESGIGLFVIVFILSFIPGYLATLQARTDRVDAVYTRTGKPSTGVALLEWYLRCGRPDAVGEHWYDWEAWFRTLGAAQSLTPGLAVARSYWPGESWVNASAVVLDAAALSLAALAAPPGGYARACLIAGERALGAVASSLRLSVNGSRASGVTRIQFDAGLDALAAAGATVTPDREQAWRDFVALRGRYEALLVALADEILVDLDAWPDAGGEPRQRASVGR
jgi:hypothetical protein